MSASFYPKKEESMNKVSQDLINFDNEMIKYLSALKILETQLEIINDNFKYIKNYNPIEHIKSRIKTKESIRKKLSKKDLSFTLKNIDNHVKDVVGIRIITTFECDIYDLVKIIKESNVIEFVSEKDYIKEPKTSGYRSYHLIVKVPVELIDKKVMVNAEIQIRTLAMDLWASLDHKLSYKTKYCTDKISSRLAEISEEIHRIDIEMSDVLTLEENIKKLQTQAS